MTRQEWKRFYSMLRKLAAQGGGPNNFPGDFHTALCHAMPRNRRFTFWSGGDEARLRDLAFALYPPRPALVGLFVVESWLDGTRRFQDHYIHPFDALSVYYELRNTLLRVCTAEGERVEEHIYSRYDRITIAHRPHGVVRVRVTTRR